MADENGRDLTAEELTAVIRDIQQRARARHPETTLGAGKLALPNLTPLVHARDAAESKVAAIGSVNPRPRGLINSLIQACKKTVARALDWHVRDQVEFNRAVVSCVHTNLEILAALNSLLAQITEQVAALREEMKRFEALERQELERLERVQREELEGVRAEARELKDVRLHWIEWRPAWEERISRHEAEMLRTIAELQGSFQHRVTLMDASFREAVKGQHNDFEARLNQYTIDVQKRLWDDMLKVRAEYEKLIHTELRLLRQRVATQPSPAVPPAPAPPAPSAADAAAPQIDWLRFWERFRGSEEEIRRRQQLYAQWFQGASDVLDVGCGRGEFLEAAKAAGIAARGIDQSEELAALGRAKGLDVERADMFAYLADLPDKSLGGVYCSQVVEHLTPAQLPELARLMAEKMHPGAPLAIETPNPECLAIFATHFYLDPTHTRPVPPALLAFYLEESGFAVSEIKRLYPAVETNPALASLPEEFRNAFFGGMDYAVFARKL